MPASLVATAGSSTAVALSWQAASDNVAVTGYRVYRNGVQVGTSASTSYQDGGLSPSTAYSYAVAAYDAAGNLSSRSTAAQATTTAATGRIIDADPTNFQTKIDALQAGDTLRLAAGTYATDPPGMSVYNLNGTPTAPITITGPESGARPVFKGGSSHNTIRISGSSYVVVRNVDVDGQNLGGDGVNAQPNVGPSHHITIEGLHIYNLADSQYTVAVSTNGSTTWNWTIRRNVIENVGTGMYLGNSDGNQPFVAGTIENNYIHDTIGYNIEIKHQNPRPTFAGMPTGKSSTVIRNNVFTKSSAVSSTGSMSRPNLLVGHWPLSGAGTTDVYEIYGNFFYKNPVEALFQGEGNIAFHDNLMVTDGDAINVMPHNDVPRNITIFNNTIVAGNRGVNVNGGAAGTTQTVIGNAIFAATPTLLSGPASQANNVTGSTASASTYLNNPTGAPGQLDLYPKAGQLAGSALDASIWTSFTAFDRDFNGTAKSWTTRGAYAGSGANPGWTPKLEVKP